ncbi:energy-coupling factor transporter transmembrane protein EcfT [Paenibacillus dendritiformis]|uniref:energy-coupling factor transporter transmembrane component T n=1 Tax=Paenibacillus dendritiformis TaxID=130049 RepID=UPI001059220B|nr:energy-coupling factor transporter transmembrane component T [Paenibacillus dendritiformis]TDL48137.1 energy-coupling factor transporter transmembrane protein EcfT [Paenibacillus dendritiformis]
MTHDSFATYHPVVNFIFFAVMFTFSMIFMHPVFQALSLVSAVVYSIQLTGKRAVRFQLIYLLPLVIVMAAMNPLFHHAGVTILFYLRSGNPITLESILYGAAAACMFVTVILWFSCYNAVMTSDKFIYLFGKVWPALSLVFAMALRFVPRYIGQIKIIAKTQQCIGRDVSQGHLVQRARNGLAIVSIMTTWALENAIDTADSMKARGYGLPNRTSFSLYRLDRRDQAMLLIMTGLIAWVTVGAFLGENTIRFFPSVKRVEVTWYSITVYIAFGLLSMLPIIVNVVEGLKWKSIASKI